MLLKQAALMVIIIVSFFIYLIVINCQYLKSLIPTGNNCCQFIFLRRFASLQGMKQYIQLHHWIDSIESSICFASFAIRSRHCEERSDVAIQTPIHNLSYKSSQSGLMPSINFNFLALDPAFICFSLAIASFIVAYSS